MEKKFRLFKGHREQDIYDVCEERRPIGINGKLMGKTRQTLLMRKVMKMSGYG